MTTSRTFALTLFAGLLLLPTLRADVHCAKLFGDHMVLQRGQSVPVWGEAAPGLEPAYRDLLPPASAPPSP